MLGFTDAAARSLILAASLGLSAPAASAQDVDMALVRKTGLGMDVYQASEVVLGKLCMESRYDGLPMADLAKREAALVQPAKDYPGTGPNDTVYRIGPLTNAVYAVDWADSTCSARAQRGDPEKLRALAERVILARPEGFTRGSHGPQDNGRVLRTVYCAQSGGDTLVASITTPGAAATGRTFALSSTVYRSPKPSPLCVATVAEQ